ncbi:hypothetical protein [Anaerophilus nitritogenes]|uniref:hypothetical protein n=1 Tax=Anaerophilus nitritogenes TaxID=2498136 RepID=UPI00101D7B7F|nr:hypothetical protein [Anaerophilus nitritogenes]
MDQYSIYNQDYGYDYDYGGYPANSQQFGGGFGFPGFGFPGFGFGRFPFFGLPFFGYPFFGFRRFRRYPFFW